MLSRIAGPAASKLGKLGETIAQKSKSAVAPITYAAHTDRTERVDRVRQEAAILATSPEQLQQRIERSLSVISDVAPGTSNEIAKVAHRATMFLASKAPISYSSPFSGRPPIVDPASADRYLRYVEAVENPIETLALL